MKKSLRLLILLTGCSLLFNCYHEPELVPGTREVCFDEEVLPVIQTSCAKSGCHDGAEEFYLGDYDGIRARVDPGKPMVSKLHKVISADHNSLIFMPPKPDEPLLPEQIDNITLWILQGAEHTTCIVECDTLNVSFKADILPMIVTNCRGCHSGDNPTGKILLTDYATIKACAEGGRLMGSVKWLPTYRQMPDKGTKLSDCKIAMLQKWIDQQMLDN